MFHRELVTSSVTINGTIITTTAYAWVHTTKLYAADSEAHSYFGVSVSLYYDTERSPSVSTAAVGAYMASGAEDSAGAVYIFRSSGSAYSPSPWSQYAKLIAPGGHANDFFGSSVSVYRNIVLIGAKEDSTVKTGAGAAYFFSKPSSQASWSCQAKVWGNDSSYYDDFGVSVSLWDDVAVIGADRCYGNAEGSGCAYIFSPSHYQIRGILYYNSLVTMTEHNVILLLTLLPVAILSLPALMFVLMWYLGKRRNPFWGRPPVPRPLAQDSSHSLPQDSAGAGKLSLGRSSLGAGSQHGLIVGQKEAYEVGYYEVLSESHMRLCACIVRFSTVAGGDKGMMMYPNYIIVPK